MRDAVIYVRGPFPFPPNVPAPEAMLRQARAVLRIDQGVLEALQRDLETHSGFISHEAAKEIVKRHVYEQELAEVLASFVVQANDFLTATESDLNQLVRIFQTWLEDEKNQQKQLLTLDEFQELRQRLPMVVGRFPGLIRQAKAKRVSEATGQPLERIELICDLRPVFDEKHEVVEGMIPLTTLKVVCRGVDGLPVGLEVILSEKDVDAIAEAAVNARNKLQSLRELLGRWQTAVPLVELTERPNNEVGDENA